MDPMDAPRLQDVARAAGVSLSTASRVLANRGDLSLATRTAVLRAAADLGYERSATRVGRPAVTDTRAIEFVCGLFGDYWADETTAGARHAALSAGLDLVMTMERNRREDDWPVRIATRRSSGAVLAIITPTALQMTEMRNLHIPLALLEPPSDPPEGVSSVTADSWQSGFDAATHLVECGYQRFAILRGEPRLRFGRAREDGFRARLRALTGIEEVETAGGDWNGSGLTESLPDDLFSDPARLGVFAYNDALAISFCRIAQRAGVRIPKDVGVIGVDGDSRGAAHSPALTTIRQPLREMSGRAVELVMQQREHPMAPAVNETLPTQLIARHTTGTV